MKPMGFWGCSHENKLIQDMAETWGESLENMTQADTLYLVARIAHEAWLDLDIDYPPTDDAEVVRDRLHELSLSQKVALIQALANS